MTTKSHFYGALVLAIVSCGGRSSPRATFNDDGALADAELGDTTVDEACSRKCECSPDHYEGCVRDCLRAADGMKFPQACLDCVAARECLEFGAAYCEIECAQGAWPNL